MIIKPFPQFISYYDRYYFDIFHQYIFKKKKKKIIDSNFFSLIIMFFCFCMFFGGRKRVIPAVFKVFIVVSNFKPTSIIILLVRSFAHAH